MKDRQTDEPAEQQEGTEKTEGADEQADAPAEGDKTDQQTDDLKDTTPANDSTEQKQE